MEDLLAGSVRVSVPPARSRVPAMATPFTVTEPEDIVATSPPWFRQSTSVATGARFLSQLAGALRSDVFRSRLVHVIVQAPAARTWIPV
ncbi:MAG: hypothetical protein E6I85_09880 [Chloroflexi bacterium]|nr:MAG: hypothetical protein E6I85_09880 [Chloroflexota bacterium]